MYKKFFLLSFYIALVTYSQAQNIQQTWNIKQAIEYAQSHAPAIKLSQAEVKAAQNTQLGAISNMIPQISSSLSLNNNYGSTINPNTNAREAMNSRYIPFSIGANIDLINWNNIMNLKYAGLNKQYAAYQAQAATHKMILEIIQKFYQYQYDKEWVNIVAQQVASIDQQIAYVEKEVEIGTRTKSDIYDIKANMGTLKEQYISAKNTAQLSKNALLQALAIDKDTINFANPLKQDEMLLKTDDKTSDIETIIRNNPAYKASRKNIEVQQQLLRVAQSNFLPNIYGFYNYSTFYSERLNMTTPVTPWKEQFKNNKSQVWGLTLSIPIFNRLETIKNVRYAKINKEKALYENEQNNLLLRNMITQMVTQLNLSKEKYELMEDNFQYQKLSFEKSEQRYKEGIIDAYTFYMVRNNWLNTNFNLVKNRNEYLMQKTLLYFLQHESL
mgnify:CR=1 FL=1